MRQSNSNEWLLAAMSEVKQEDVTSTVSSGNTATSSNLLSVSPTVAHKSLNAAKEATKFYIDMSSEDEKTDSGCERQAPENRQIMQAANRPNS